MMLKLLSNQIPDYWEVIKHTISNTDAVEDQNLPGYLNNLLHDLLSDKAQCFFRIDPESRKIYTVVVTRIEENRLSGYKTFIMQSVFSFEAEDIKKRELERDFLKDFAKRRECSSIVFKSPHPAAWKLGKAMGFKEIHRAYMYQL